MTALACIAALTPLGAFTKPLGYNFAARCSKCGWISKATPAPELLPSECPHCPPKGE